MAAMVVLVVVVVEGKMKMETSNKILLARSIYGAIALGTSHACLTHEVSIIVELILQMSRRRLRFLLSSHILPGAELGFLHRSASLQSDQVTQSGMCKAKTTTPYRTTSSFPEYPQCIRSVRRGQETSPLLPTLGKLPHHVPVSHSSHILQIIDPCHLQICCS